jgi:hypothetical protein
MFAFLLHTSCNSALPLLIVEHWTDFWRQLWGKGVDYFCTQFIEKRQLECEGTVDFEVMKTHKAFQLTLSGLLLRDEWKLAWEHAQEVKEAGFIIIGQPGIGMHIIFRFSFRLTKISCYRQESLSLLLSGNAFGEWFTNIVPIICRSRMVLWQRWHSFL